MRHSSLSPFLFYFITTKQGDWATNGWTCAYVLCYFIFYFNLNKNTDGLDTKSQEKVHRWEGKGRKGKLPDIAIRHRVSRAYRAITTHVCYPHTHPKTKKQALTGFAARVPAMGNLVCIGRKEGKVSRAGRKKEDWRIHIGSFRLGRCCHCYCHVRLLVTPFGAETVHGTNLLEGE